MTFDEWFDEFFDTYCNGVLSHDCAVEYRIINDKHLYPIADMELESIKPIHIQKCLKTAIGLSSSRQRKVYFLMKRCFREAVVNEYCTKNPVEKIPPPKKVFKEIQLLSNDQINKLFAVETPDILMFKLEIYTGLRRGEILALAWNNINFDEEYITVCQTLVSSSGHSEIRASTKNNHGRLVPLSSEAVRILNAVKESDNIESEYVFHNSKGKHLSFRAYHDRYKAFYAERQKEYPNIPYIPPHKLRHIFATHILQCGADIETTRRLLGHSNITTTSIYVHSSYEQMQTATKNLKY